ncbi:hypothetical protein AVEN_80365-1 [Araneus ventricosus]|uniref:RNase H type-1 domain-containing protein n=1 Tax=Araneus ventricosus TaxID=182803 RepID=A0A4Y2UDM2_ARAVE|nr:hypothetical protein AVEN_80365-1 [Araneus ventricosus]
MGRKDAGVDFSTLAPEVCKLSSLMYAIELHWVRAHQGQLGNERADELT